MLEALFSSAARVKLLKVLLLERNGEFYLRELAGDREESGGGAG